MINMTNKTVNIALAHDFVMLRKGAIRHIERNDRMRSLCKRIFFSLVRPGCTRTSRKKNDNNRIKLNAATAQKATRIGSVTLGCISSHSF